MSSPTTDEVIATDVVVVGAGPTGVAVATLLDEQGLDVVVLERWPNLYPLPRAVHLDDEVFRILARLGVGEEFARISTPGLGLRLVGPNHRVLAEFRRDRLVGRHGHPEANMYDQPDLEAVLRERLEKAPGVRLLSSHEVRTVDADVDEVRVVAHRLDASGAAGEAVRVRGRYLLGCDGANSLVRTSIGAAMRDLGFEQRWLVADVRSRGELDQWRGVHQVCSSERAATFMRIGPARYRWEFRLSPGENAADYSTLDDLAPLLRPWVADPTATGLELVRCVDYTFMARVSSRWRDGRVFLLGDAAHLTPPFIGQGLGAGLRDAANLAWKLGAVERGEAAPSLLDTYEAERSEHAEQMIRLARQVGLAMTAGGRLADLVRAAVVPSLRFLPRIGRRVVDSETPGLPAALSTLIGRSLPGRLEGTLAPNAALGEATLDTALGSHGLVLSAAEPWLAAPLARLLRAPLVEVAPGTPLARWLRGHGCQVVAVRPDGTVLAGARHVGEISRIHDALARIWTDPGY